jgi:ABC-type antimicrobial peptide transport system permease subunit
VQELQQALQTVHADLPLANVRTLGAIYDRSIARTALVSMLLSVAGGMALILGLIGTYGVVAYSVMQRRREIGIRMALGSTGRSITGMFVRQGLALAGAGAMLGMLGSVWVARLIRSLLFGVSSFDPLTYGGVLGLLLLAAALASWLPARKAAAADPIEVLRAE